jgi:hypothetical protein
MTSIAVLIVYLKRNLKNNYEKIQFNPNVITMPSHK